MTRINCIPPWELTDKHLIAEYRELPRVFKLARAIPAADMPKHYRLGKGHVIFFYDKLQYCYNRQHLLVSEMKSRGFKPKYDPADLLHYHEAAGGSTPDSLWNDWVPTPTEQLINRARIKERLSK